MAKASASSLRVEDHLLVWSGVVVVYVCVSVCLAEALHLANLICATGYIFPIDDHILVVKNDGAYYRFQVCYSVLLLLHVTCGLLIPLPHVDGVCILTRVRVCVYMQDYWKSYGWICVKYVVYVPEKPWLNFGRSGLWFKVIVSALAARQ